VTPIASGAVAIERERILILVTLAETGGAQTYVRELVSTLGAYDVIVAAHGDGPLIESVRRDGARYVALRHVRRPISPFRDLLGLVELWRLCRTVRPAVVHVNSAKAGILGRLAARLARVPATVYTVHGWAFKVPGDRGAFFYRLLERLLAPLATAVICVSEREREAGVTVRACRPERTVVIHNAVSVSEAQVRDHGAASGPVRVVSVGRLAPPKDFDTLVDAVALLEPGRAVVDVLGEGPELAGLSARAGSTVTFHGNVDDVPSRLAGADVFVLSSRSEGLPISVLEAMAAGLPVVASDVGGIAEMVADGVGGYVVPPGEASVLAARLAELVDDPTRRASMGAAARRRALEEFDTPRWAERHAAVYRALLERDSGRRLAAVCALADCGQAR